MKNNSTACRTSTFLGPPTSSTAFRVPPPEPILTPSGSDTARISTSFVPSIPLTPTLCISSSRYALEALGLGAVIARQSNGDASGTRHRWWQQALRACFAAPAFFARIGSEKSAICCSRSAVDSSGKDEEGRGRGMCTRRVMSEPTNYQTLPDFASCGVFFFDAAELQTTLDYF